MVPKLCALHYSIYTHTVIFNCCILNLNNLNRIILFYLWCASGQSASEIKYISDVYDQQTKSKIILKTIIFSSNERFRKPKPDRVNEDGSVKASKAIKVENR